MLGLIEWEATWLITQLSAVGGRPVPLLDIGSQNIVWDIGYESDDEPSESGVRVLSDANLGAFLL